MSKQYTVDYNSEEDLFTLYEFGFVYAQHKCIIELLDNHNLAIVHPTDSSVCWDHDEMVRLIEEKENYEIIPTIVEEDECPTKS